MNYLKKYSSMLFAFFVGISLPLNSVAKQLPELGNNDRTVLSIKEEKLIGDLWLRQLRSANLVCEDTIINSYLNYIGQRLVIHADAKQFKYKFFAIEDQSINAFAFFGGNIGIHKGLILATQNEQELAGAIAHEIAHITQEHLLRSIVKSRQSMPIVIAGALTSSLLGAPDLAIPILAIHQQKVINFTREHEQEADNVGLQVLADAGFDPHGMITLFKRMDQYGQYNIAIPEYLRTHPMFENRISEAQQRAKNFHYCQHRSTFNYFLIKARVESTATSNQQETIANFEEQLNKKRYANKDATLYGYSLALAANYQYEQAYNILGLLAKKYPNNLIIQLGMVDLMLAKKEYAQAITCMEVLLNKFPNDPALLLKYAENLLVVNKAAQAKKSLLVLTNTKVFEPITYRLLAQAEGLLGNNIAMHQATAEWHDCYGNMENAIIQLDLALKLAKDDRYLQSNIKKRKEEITSLMQGKATS